MVISDIHGPFHVGDEHIRGGRRPMAILEACAASCPQHVDAFFLCCRASVQVSTSGADRCKYISQVARVGFGQGRLSVQ